MRKFNSHSIPIRLNLLFSIVILLLMTIIGRLLYMQVLNKDFYEKKLASASQTKVTTSSARGEIYDASGKPLVENTLKQVVSFTRSNKMTATDLKEIAKKLLTYVSISSPNLTERQLADYYLADPEIYKKQWKLSQVRNAWIQMAIAYPNQNCITMRSIVFQQVN